MSVSLSIYIDRQGEREDKLVIIDLEKIKERGDSCRYEMKKEKIEAKIEIFR